MDLSPPVPPPKDRRPTVSASPTTGLRANRRLSLGLLNRAQGTLTSNAEGQPVQGGRSERSTSEGRTRQRGASSRKVKNFFRGLGAKKKPKGSSNILVGSHSQADADNSTAIHPDIEPDQSTSQVPNLPHRSLSETGPVVPALSQTIKKPTANLSDTGSDDTPDLDLYHQAIQNAQKKVERLQTTTMVLKTLATGLSLGTAWMPGVGQAVGVVVSMLSSAQKIAIGKVSALRLVGRSAGVLEAVEVAIIECRGAVSPVMQSHILELISHLRANNRFLLKLAERSFLKLYLHADDSNKQIVGATEDLEDFIRIFELQSHISTAAWEQQTKEDHDDDMTILLRKLDEARQSDQKMLEALSIKSEAQQEAIKTLQRTLDHMLAMQEAEYRTHHPSGSLTTIRSRTYARLEALNLGPTSFTEPHAQDTVRKRPKATNTERPTSLVQTTDNQFLEANEEHAIEQVSQFKSAPPVAEAMHEASHRQLPSVWESGGQTGEDSGLHREFFEKALDVLRRTSQETTKDVPDWTITPLEISHDEPISHEERINSGYFSVIWRGRWKTADVAIKELTPMADRQLFIREVEIWRRLKSDRILTFYGASSTTGPPPWFLVSPYLKNGNILTFLKTQLGKILDRELLIYEMTQGMEYLHSRDIVHGDFKASNALITDQVHAVICDFGLSQLKMNFNSKSQGSLGDTDPSAGTLRWQSPERLAGGPSTKENDVYAWAMAVYEIITDMVPFGHVDDSIVRKAVQNGERPEQPADVDHRLWDLVERCWAQDSSSRPTFAEILTELEGMWDMHVAQRPQRTDTLTTMLSSSEDTEGSYRTASETSVMDGQRSPHTTSNPISMIETGDEWSSSSGSILSIPPHLQGYPTFESDRAERHYRHYLQHNFDDRLSIPLWFPSLVPLGSVGFVRNGQFTHLLDAHMPVLGEEQPPFSHLPDFSSAQIVTAAVNTRGATEKGLDMVAAFTNYMKPSGEGDQGAISRKIDFPLRPGMKQAALVVEDGQFEIFKSLTIHRAYLTANIHWILDRYSDRHHIGKEDVIMVVGALTTRNYSMMVSNFAPRTTISFNVRAISQRVRGEPWGTWTVDRRHASGSAILDENVLKYSCKVSKAFNPAAAVLLAKLKFAPGASEPTLYP